MSWDLLIILHFCIFQACTSAGEGKKPMSKETLLTKRLLEDYVRTSRPVLQDGTVTNLTMDIAFNSILDIDEQQQTMLAALWLRVGWMDEYLSWNETNNGIKRIVVSPEDVWMPDLTLMNNAHEEVQSLPMDKLLTVNSSGYVTWLQPAVIKSQCTLNSFYFPFDIQSCPLVFGSWVYSASQVNLFPKLNTGDVSEFSPNGVWELHEFPVVRESRLYQCCEDRFTTLTYYAVLKRLSLFFVFHLYFPCLFLSFASLMVFYLPSDSGEKVSFSVTMLLSVTVFMLVASEYLPPSSQNIPIIARYFFGTIGLLTLCLGASVLVLQIHHRGDYGTPPPKWLRRVVFTYLTRMFCLSRFGTEVQAKNAYSLNQTLDLTEPGFGTEGGEATVQEWSKIAAIIDRILLVLFFLAAVALTAYVFASYSLADFGHHQLSHQSFGNITVL